MIYSYKFRLYPNVSQRKRLAQHFGASRWVYNHFLSRRNELYLLNKEKEVSERRPLNYPEDCKELVQLKKQPEFAWLKLSIAQSLQASLKTLDGAFGNFFDKRAAFPKFKKRGGKNSFHIPQKETFRIERSHIFIPKFLEGIKAEIHRELEGELRSATISLNSAGQYHISILVQKEDFAPFQSGREVGVDLGLKSFLVTSDGLEVKPPKVLRQFEFRLAFLQQELSRKKKGSKNRAKARLKVARLHLHIANIRKDFLHKLSIKLIRENQTIVFEDLNVKGMTKNHKLAKSISDASWSEFISMVQYKASWYGREVVQVDRFYPSSKTCFNCNFIVDKLTLDQREWTCPSCKTILNRDLNAARNILRQGLNRRNGEVSQLSCRSFTVGLESAIVS
jgi:putative transposase